MVLTKTIAKVWLIMAVMALFCGYAMASDYHVLTVNKKADKPQVAFHIPVPDELNAAGINLQTAVKTDLAQVSQVPWLEVDFPVEYTGIQNGVIYEKVETVQVNANATNLEKQAAIDARYNELALKVPDVLRARYKFWGMNRDLP